MREEPEHEGPERVLDEDALVRQLRPAPRGPAPSTVEVAGYLGRDTEEGYWRLYLNARLDSYLRIAEGDIIARSAGTDAGGRDVSHLIVRAAAPVETVQSMTAVQASFLRGAYTASMLGSSSASMLNAAAPRRRRISAEDLSYPQSGIPIICPPQITIEFQSCFCTLFCPTTPVICPVTLAE